MRSRRDARDAFNNTTSPAFTKCLHRVRRRLDIRKFNHPVQAGVARRRGHHRRHLADGEQLADAQFRRAPAHFRVRRFAVRAEFGHVAQHRHAPALARQVAQRLQRRQHRIRVRVVGVVEHAHAAGFPKLHPHLRRLAFGQAVPHFARRPRPSSSPTATAKSALTT